MNQVAFDLAREERPAPRLKYLAGLNPIHESFVRLAAQRVAELVLPGEVEAALQEAHVLGYMASVESLAAYGIGDRLWQLPPLERQRRLDGLLQPLKGKVEDQLRRLRARAESIERVGDLRRAR